MSTAAERQSPYVGLAPFTEADADFFFGRKRDAALIVANVFASPLTVLYGPSGVGKTSVLEAGVVPSLRERGLAPTVVRAWSGDAATALRLGVAERAGEGERAGTPREVLLLDDFEDLFHGSAGDEFAAELAGIVTRPGRATSVLLAIREDALAKLDRFEGRVPGLLDNVLRLEHLDREQAREAILAPRDRWNEVASPSERFEVEDALVEALLDATPAGEGRVETLLLQLVLGRLWDVRGPSGPYVLGLETFEALGGVPGIVDEYVTGTLDALDSERKEQAAEILEHLVTPSRLRLAQRASDLAGFAGVTEYDLRPLLDTLSASRILRPVSDSSAGFRYEVHHESLADAVLAWRTRYVTERELAAARRRFRRRLALALVAAVLLAVLAAVGTYAWSQRQTARSQALSAEATGLLAIDPEAALDTALDAVDARSLPAAENALRASVAAAHGRGAFGGDDDRIADVDVARDGRVLSRGADGSLTLRSADGAVLRTYGGLGRVQDAALCPTPQRVVASAEGGTFVLSGSGRQRLRGAPASALVVECSAEGSTILVADEEVARLYTGAGRPVARVDADELGGIDAAALSPDGSLVAVASPEETRVLRLPGGAVAARIRQPLASLAFTPDGSRLVAGDKDGQVLIRSLARGGDTLVLSGHTQLVSDVEVSPDGRLLVSASTDRIARVWDAVGGEEIALLRGHTGPVRTASFGPGTTVVTVADDGTARIWEAPVTSVLVGHTGRIVDVAITPSGSRVATASEDQTVRVWDPATGRELARLLVPFVVSVAISPNGRRLLTRQSIDGRARLWDVRQPRRPILIPVDGPLSAVFTPDGRFVATARWTVQFFDLGGRPVRSIGVPARLDEVGQLAFAPQGDRLAVADVPEGYVVVLDADSGSELAGLAEPALRALALAFDDAGDSLATAESGGVARAWDARDGTPEPPALAGHQGPVLDVSFADESRLVATGGSDDTVRLWHVDTGVELFRAPGSAAAFARLAPVLVTAGPGTTARVLPCGPCGSISELRDRAVGR